MLEEHEPLPIDRLVPRYRDPQLEERARPSDRGYPRVIEEPVPHNPHAYVEALRAHYASVWGPPLATRQWTRGPVHDLGETFAIQVHDAPPDAIAFATVGMSLHSSAQAIELYVLAPRDLVDRDPLVELLTVVAHYHRTGPGLGLSDTVNFGRPWLPQSTCSFGLVSLPYIDGLELELPKGLETRCYWLLPITSQELVYKKNHGVEALEDAFERAELDYLNPLRPSVV